MNKNPSFLFFIACLVFLSSSVSADHEVVSDCTISADSLFSTGEVIRGTGSDIAGVELVDWIHDTPGLSFETVGDPGTVAFPDNGIECRINGTTTADIIGEFTALVDGTPGFSYLIDIEDNRPPQSADQIRLCSTLVQHPRTRNVGSSVFTTPRLAVIPEVIPVNLGEAGSGKARLQLDSIKCSYRGTGTPGANYAFERCSGPGGHALVPGDTLSVSEVSLRIQSADRSEPVTSVQVELGTVTEHPGVPDFYSILIADSGGATFYTFSGNVECGDIAIDLLPHP